MNDSPVVVVQMYKFENIVHNIIWGILKDNTNKHLIEWWNKHRW